MRRRRDAYSDDNQLLFQVPVGKVDNFEPPRRVRGREPRAIVIENGNVKAINDEGEPMTIKK